MPQQAGTYPLRGGLNLVTPPLAVPPGQAIAAVNYEPEVAGYRRMAGYERFDGSPSPSEGADASEIASRRADIEEVPGTGKVRGVVIFDGAIWAFRDTVGGEGAMYKSTSTGWEQQSFGDMLHFTGGTADFVETETVTGGTSGATGRIERHVIESGSAAGMDTAGYLILSSLSGSFQQGEAITSASGAATCAGSEAVQLSVGGEYVFTVHNFYGPAKRPRLYFTNGVQPAMEWDGEVLAPIRSGNASGPLDLSDFALNETGGYILLPDDGRVLLAPDFDRPQHCAPFSNHLFLGFRNGGVVFSGVGEPLDFRTSAGAGELGVSDEITGLLGGATTALIIFCRNRIEYLTGNDSSDFVLKTISDSSGAYAYSAQALDQPFYLDDAGLRKMSTTDAFGDWRMGTVTQPIEPLMRTKRQAGVRPAASLKVKNRDQYRLFWDDGTGLVVYFGRKDAETLPFKLPITVSCAVAGEVSTADGGERLFVGATDGFVYEMDKGTSFDGTAIDAYLRLVWNTLGGPSVNKRFHKATFEMDAPTATTLGVVWAVDYGRRQEGAGGQVDKTVGAGSRSDWEIEDYASIDWTLADHGVLEHWIDAFGQNIALTLVSSTATEEPHTLSSMTLNYTPRRMVR